MKILFVSLFLAVTRRVETLVVGRFAAGLV